MIKKLAIALSLALALVLAVGTACFAGTPPDGDNLDGGFNINWSGGVDCGTVGVGGSVCTDNTFTEFSSSGSAIYGCFNADSGPCCGETSNSLAALAVNGKTKYFTASGDEDSGQFVKLEAGSDCLSGMLVYTETKCSDMDSWYALGAIGCEYEVEAEAADYDCGYLHNYVLVDAEGEAGYAAILGTANDDGIGNLVFTKSNGPGELDVVAVSTGTAQINGVAVNNGAIALIADYGDGIDANICVSAGEPFNNVMAD